jgi:predicted nucleic acid-binding protein
MSFSVIYDANVLFPFEVRDILMVAARTSTFAVYWTDAILDETTRNLIAKGLATNENMTRMVAKMKELYPEATIPLVDYEDLIPVMTNNAKDRHVLAAAVAKKVNVIVTHNLKHFPDTALDGYDIEAQLPDEFVRHVLDLAPSTFIHFFRLQASLRQKSALIRGRTPRTAEEIAADLISTDLPMPKTSSYLLNCLANPRYGLERG